VKGLICGLLLACLVLSGCAGAPEPEQKQYTATFLTLFDTLTTIKGPAESEEAFQETVQLIHDELLECHRLFDIYNDYEGIHNLKTVNDAAGIAPVTVDRRIIDLLLDCKAFYTATGGKVNVAMGSVLQLWHEARNDGLNNPAAAYLPEQEALEEAATHCSMDSLVIEGDALVYVRTGKKIGTYNAATGELIDDATNTVVAIVDMENGMVYPVANNGSAANE